ncbi:MAG: hypothetical protein Q7W44_04205 [Coriobacteriia bacterium]|nr:hypothetical protein [Coriobacteriia bacterium]
MKRTSEQAESSVIRDLLAARLRAGGDWPESWGDAALPIEAFDRWVNVSSLSDWALHATSQSAQDLIDWWRDAYPGARHYVLNGAAISEETVEADAPAWWPVYERTLSDAVKPWTHRTLEAALRGLGPNADDEDTYEAALAVAQDLSKRTGARVADSLAYIMEGTPLRIAPLKGRIVPGGGGVPRIEITVASPLVDSRAVASLYERLAQSVRPLYGTPPNVEPESVRFYLAYEDLERAGIRRKADRLEALPADLRKGRNPNSAAAYFGKLRKAFRQAFTFGGGLDRDFIDWFTTGSDSKEDGDNA